VRPVIVKKYTIADHDFSETPPVTKLIRKPRLALALLILAALVATAVFLPLEEMVADLQAWVDANPDWSFPVVTGCLVAGILLLLPAAVMMMIAGFLFGITKGFMAVWVATLFASTAAFLIGRKLARPLIKRRLARKPEYEVIDEAIRRKGFYVVLLTRLVLFLPFPLLNYTHGLTDVRLRDYLLGTMIGMVPPIFLFVYLGTLASNVADIVNGRVELEGMQLTLLIAAATAVMVVVALIVVAARRALRAEIAKAAEEH